MRRDVELGPPLRVLQRIKAVLRSISKHLVSFFDNVLWLINQEITIGISRDQNDFKGPVYCRRH